jgi:exopolysaccharide biosynthesis WecB/TagA/CpsF family protein
MAKALWSRPMSLYDRLQLPAKRPPVAIGDLAIEALSLEETAQAFVAYCRSEARREASRPLYSTSVNGQVISLCARDKSLVELFRQADSVNADGQPMVTMSHFLTCAPLPERVATTDLYPVVAGLAEKSGLTFYLLGGTERANRRAVEETQKAFPKLRIVGCRHGYLRRREDAEDAICAEIAALKPDILWVAFGAPLEQQFCSRNLAKLKGVGVVKTSGGLFDFISRERPRAPTWMQKFGFEWLFRTLQEPRRLLMRYLTTNPHALYVMLTSMR